MKIRIVRKPTEDGATIGAMEINGEFVCFTLEDPVREVPGLPVLEWKIPGETAIPRGEYRVIVDFSNRFQRCLPLLVAVPGYSGVRIHPGNTAKDTEGCILVGTTEGKAFIGHSREAFAHVFDLIQKAVEAGEDVWITVE